MAKSKNNTGVLFRNTKKENDNQPSLKGHIVIDNEKYWLSGWTKNSEKTGKYISLAATKVIGKVQQKLNEEN